MPLLFTVAAVVGGVLLLAVLVLAVFGAGHDGDALAAHDVPSDGLQLFSLRAASAGIAFFGLAGLGATRLGWPALVALAAAALAGLVAAVVVALAMRVLLRLEHDATVRVDRAVGEAGTVYVPVPAAHGGVGKVLVTLRGRTVELQAVTREPHPIQTGAAVVVVEVRDDDTVEVVPYPAIEEVM